MISNLALQCLNHDHYIHDHFYPFFENGFSEEIVPKVKHIHNKWAGLNETAAKSVKNGTC